LHVIHKENRAINHGRKAHPRRNQQIKPHTLPPKLCRYGELGLKSCQQIVRGMAARRLPAPLGPRPLPWAMPRAMTAKSTLRSYRGSGAVNERGHQQRRPLLIQLAGSFFERRVRTGPASPRFVLRVLALRLRPTVSRYDRFRRPGKSSGPPPFASSLNVQGDDTHNSSGFR
jgi:hypothetical protein